MNNCVSPEMHYALIAAGEGSRLREEGIAEPKPLVRILGVPMIERLIGIFMQNGARSISVICNKRMKEVRDFLETLKKTDLLCAVDKNGVSYVCQLNIVVKDTPSSMHSLAALMDVIPEGRFCLTTVDTVFSATEFSAYIRAFSDANSREYDGLFAVTPFVDDEKPLWVAVSAQKSFSRACGKYACGSSDITGFYDKESDIPREDEKMVSGGIYCLDTHKAFPVLRDCLSQGQSRMRNFQRALIAAGLRIRAFVFPRIMDIDHASDIQNAEAWLSRKALAISRDGCYSPNNMEKDASILHAVVICLRNRGWQVDECSEQDWQNKHEEYLSSDYRAIFHMMRHQKSLDLLAKSGSYVLNRPDAVQMVVKSRTRTMSILQEQGIRVATDEGTLPVWVKVMREEGVRSTDVSFIQTKQELDFLSKELKEQRVLDIQISRHIVGELVKCYAVVSGTQKELVFLRWFRPQQVSYSKFGEAEVHNSRLADMTIDKDLLSSIAMAISQASGLQVFGFDAIVGQDGEITVIDVNDWPSFSLFQEEAAGAIASVIDDNCKEQ